MLLPVIAAGVWLDGQRYDPGLLDFKSSANRLSVLSGFFPEQVAGLKRQGEIRFFRRDNLYEYVNGHAEFFIGAGFKELAVGEYGAGPRVVVDVYDMGKPLQAFGVVTQEQQGDSHEVAIGEMGNGDGRGLRFILGQYYVKMTAFADGEPLESLGRGFVEAMGKVGKGVGTFRFPDFGPVLTTYFIKDNYRGVDFFDSVLERTFQGQGRKVQVFLAGEDLQTSQALESRLLAFLQQEEIPVEQVKQAGFVVHVVRDPYEGEWLFLRHKDRVIGAFGILLADAIGPIKRFIDDGDTAQINKTH